MGNRLHIPGNCGRVSGYGETGQSRILGAIYDVTVRSKGTANLFYEDWDREYVLGRKERGNSPARPKTCRKTTVILMARADPLSPRLDRRLAAKQR